MATIKFLISDLKPYGIEKPKLERIVASLGMEVEKIDDGEVTIDITANRPDLLDIAGFGRAASCFLGKKILKEGYYKIIDSPILQIKVSSSVKRIRPFIAAFVVKNVEMSSNRLKYLINFTEKFCDTYGRKRKKLAIGLHNFDNVKGSLLYSVGNESIIPLGNSRSMSFENTLKETEKGREYGNIISSFKGSYPYLKDSEKVISLIPITNSEATKVTKNTKNLFIEVTGTSKSAVEQTAALMACSFIDEGVRVLPCTIIYNNTTVKTPELGYREMRIKPAEVDRALGTSLLDFNSIITLLGKMGHSAAKYGNNVIAYIAPYRLDVIDERDLIEDIAIAYGYDKITPLPIVGAEVGMYGELSEWIDRISIKMVGLGFSEAINNNLTNQKMNFANMGRKYEENSIVSIAQSKSESITMLRTSVVPSLLHNLAISTHESMPQKLFEIGKGFSLKKGKIIERNILAFVSEHPKANFSELKSVVEALLQTSVTDQIKLKEHNTPEFIDGRCALILIGTTQVGIIGEVTPQVLTNFKIDDPVVAAELDLDIIIAGR